MYNNNVYGNGQMGMGGTNYNKPMVPKVTQALTKEEYDKLKNNSKGDFSFKVDPEEKIMAMCTHKDPNNGQTTLQTNGDGTCTCWVCGKTFNLIDNPDLVEQVTVEMHNILQTIKTYYLDIPVEFAREYFQILPLLEKVPKLFKYATNCFQKYENGGLGVNQNGAMNTFNMYNSIGGMGMGYGQPQQQMYGGYGQPQQQMYGGYGQPQQPTYQDPYASQGQQSGYNPNPFVGGGQAQGQYNQGGYAPQQQEGFAPQGGGYAPGVTGQPMNQQQSALVGNGNTQTGNRVTNETTTTKILDV